MESRVILAATLLDREFIHYERDIKGDLCHVHWKIKNQTVTKGAYLIAIIHTRSAKNALEL